MRDTGIDMPDRLATGPGVQVLDKATAVTMARESNDLLADAVRQHPMHYAGLPLRAARPAGRAAREIEKRRAYARTQGRDHQFAHAGEYLDDEKFWDILEAAEALDVPIYLHPTYLSRALLRAFPRARTRRGDLWLRLRDRPSHAQDHRER